MGDATLPHRPLGEVFRVFLRLGLTSFGGPVAHLAYFREELVHRRRWITEADYADLVALCQFLPGPGSTKVGFALGLLRGGGLLGGLVAWSAFTLPSALVLFLFALGASVLEGPVAAGVIHGLKLVSVAVVAHAVLGMARVLTPDATRIAIALAAIGIALGIGGGTGQIAAITVGALGGLWFCRAGATLSALSLRYPIRRREGTIALVLLTLLLLVPPFLATTSGPLTVFNAFYRSGALVFGGGHVLLPLLEAEVVAPGWVSPEAFLAGYGLAQAIPGPLFTFAAYLGALMQPMVGAASGASLALMAVFLPGLLLTYGALPFWNNLRGHPRIQAAMRGANAGVVGILAAALYTPVWTGSVSGIIDVVLIVLSLGLMLGRGWPAWRIVLLLGGIGAATGWLSA